MTHTTHLFLDFENVEPPAEEIALVRGPQFRLWILHGPHQKKVPADLAKAWQPLGEQVEYIQSPKSGKNALDLHIAYCLGGVRQRESQHQNQAIYVIVSRDKDFDPLIEYVTSEGGKIGRVNSISDALAFAAKLSPQPATKSPVVSSEKKPTTPKAKPAQKVAASPNTAEVVAHLRDHPKNRPTSRKKLEHYLESNLGNKGDAKTVALLIAELTSLGILRFEGTKAHYTFPKGK